MTEPPVNADFRKTSRVLVALLEHPLRPAIVTRLLRGPASPTEIAADFGVSVGVADYHLRQLQAAKVVRLAGRHRPKGRRGHPQKWYTAESPVISPEEWVALPELVRGTLKRAVMRELAATAASSGEDYSERAPEATLAQVADELSGLLATVVASLPDAASTSDSRALDSEVA